MKSRKSRKKRANKSVTIRDVAKRASVSVSSVSRVLNKSPRVREKIRQRIEKAMSAMNFSPNMIASTLAKNHSGSIGLVIPHMGPVFAPLVNEIEQAVRAERNYLVVVTGKNDPDEVAQSVHFLQQRRCDALIVFPGTMSSRQISAMLDEHRNIVILHHALPKHMDRCVLVDNRAGARMATRYLIDCGHRDIAVITGSPGNQESDARYAAFVETMTDAGLKVDNNLVIPGGFDLNSGEHCAAQLLATGRRFSALFCFSDEIAAGAISYLRSTGITLPRDISIVGFDDVQYCSRIFPRLTTISQPIAEIGRIAALRALALSADGELPTLPSVLTPTLIVRDSVTPRRSTKMPAGETSQAPMYRA